MYSRTALSTFLVLLLAHLAALAFAIGAAPEPAPPTVEPPKLQGLLIAPEPQITKTPPPPAPKPEPKPEPKPVKRPPIKKQPELKLAKTSAPSPITAPIEPVTPRPVKPMVPPRRQQASVSTTTPTPAVQLPSADAAGLNNKAPQYPMLSRKRKEQGTVWLLLLVDKNGLVSELKLKTSSGFARLDEAALRAVKHWKFQPAMKEGQAIDYWYELPVKFSLNQQAG